MKLYAVTPECPLPDEAARIARLLSPEGGFAAVSLRHPGTGADELARIIEAVPKELRGRLRLHDCFELAVRYRLGGIQLNRRNPEAPEGWTGATGRSCHTLAELRQARADGMDFATISPVFPSISKPGYEPTLTPDELAEAAAMEGIEVIALGGVTPARIPELAALGFSSAAMLSAAWQ